MDPLHSWTSISIGALLVSESSNGLLLPHLTVSAPREYVLLILFIFPDLDSLSSLHSGSDFVEMSEGTEHVPGMHDPAFKAALLKKSNDEMRKRIMDLKQGLDQERNRLKETHREKVKELHDLRDNSEVTISSTSCLPPHTTQLEKHRTLEAQKTKLLETQAQELKRLHDEMQREKEVDFQRMKTQWEKYVALL